MENNNKNKYMILSFITIITIEIVILVLMLNINFFDNKKSDIIVSDSSDLYNAAPVSITELDSSHTVLISETQSTDSSNIVTQEFEDGYYIGEKNLKIPLLIYHAFDDVLPKNDTWNLYVTVDRFEENIKTLLDDGYHFITFDDLYEYSNGNKKLPEKNIIITIDDGYKNNYTKAYPILQKYNVKANIFIITDYRGNEYMSYDEIREMYQSGLVKFYSHGKQHIDYTSISVSQLKKDILESHEELERELGDEILKVFAYPSGISNTQTRNALKSIGFDIQVLTKYGTVNTSRNIKLTELGRIRVNDTTTGSSIIKTINNSK